MYIYIHKTLKWEEEGAVVFSRNWFIINDEVAHKSPIKCTKIVKLRNIGEYLYKATCK
jgi:hypothetical protein